MPYFISYVFRGGDRSRHRPAVSEVESDPVAGQPSPKGAGLPTTLSHILSRRRKQMICKVASPVILSNTLVKFPVLYCNVLESSVLCLGRTPCSPRHSFSVRLSTPVTTRQYHHGKIACRLHQAAWAFCGIVQRGGEREQFAQIYVDILTSAHPCSLYPSTRWHPFTGDLSEFPGT